MARSDGLDAYIPRMGDIHGAFHNVDAYVFEAISESQVESGATGDILEIGAYLGRSAIVLGYLLGENETLHICEPFPNPSAAHPDFLPETIDWYETYTQEIFEENYLRFHDELPEIYAHTSFELPGKLAPKSFRFVHLDGSHNAEALESDISLTKDILIDRGVISFSVYRNMSTLEVAAAVWGEVAESSLFPICATESHLYASVTPYSSAETADLHARLQSTPRMNVVPSEFRGVEVALMQPVPSAKLKSYVPPVLLPLARRARSWVRTIRTD
ncbi:MAG: class I SAM-dependent methyltransferase [Actinobacteria bacterium]|nr:class I SAM-dependent methyltransferase [Actinomycetota bacterium]